MYTVKMDTMQIGLCMVVMAIGLYVPYKIFQRKKVYRKKDDTNSKFGQKLSNEESGIEDTGVVDVKSSKQNTGSSKQQQQQKNQQRISSGNTVNKRIANDSKNFNHPWSVTTLSGHTKSVSDIDLSSNGKYLVTCSEDRSLLLWTATNIGDTQNRKSVRVNVEYDHAIKVAWSPDTKALIIVKSIGNCIEVYKIDKKDNFFTNPSKAITFPRMSDDSEIISLGIACTGRFIMTCSNKTDLILWDLKGNILEKIDTYLMNNFSAKISICGRFIAACGFSPDVKVYEVKFTKNGEYIKTTNVFNLSGHSSGVYDVGFDQDSSHMATVSKDGSWKLFDTKIEFDLGQSVRCIITSKYKQSSMPSLIAVSPINAGVIAIASGSDIEIFSGTTGNRHILIENIYNGNTVALKFDPMGKMILAAGDRYVRVFHNVLGYKIVIDMTKEKLAAWKPNHPTATKERLEKLIKENEDFLKKLFNEN